MLAEALPPSVVELVPEKTERVVGTTVDPAPSVVEQFSDAKGWVVATIMDPVAPVVVGAVALVNVADNPAEF